MPIHPASAESSEEALVKLYADLTGASEGTARSVFAAVCSERGQEMDRPWDSQMTPLTILEQAPIATRPVHSVPDQPQATVNIPVPKLATQN